jgi:CheY-like chemotaxis protein
MGLTILVVDDNKLALRLAQLSLQKEGHTVIALENWADTGTELFGREIDLALIDVNMPGLQGDSLVRILRQSRRGQRTPIVLLSDLPEEALRQKAQACLADDWMRKPLDVPKLREKIQRICHRA